MSTLSDLDAIINRLRYVKRGDYVLSSDHNDLVDAVRCIRNILGVHEGLQLTKYVIGPGSKYEDFDDAIDDINADIDNGIDVIYVFFKAKPREDGKQYTWTKVIDLNNTPITIVLDGGGFWNGPYLDIQVSEPFANYPNPSWGLPATLVIQRMFADSPSPIVLDYMNVVANNAQLPMISGKNICVHAFRSLFSLDDWPAAENATVYMRLIANMSQGIIYVSTNTSHLYIGLIASNLLITIGRYTPARNYVVDLLAGSNSTIEFEFENDTYTLNNAYIWRAGEAYGLPLWGPPAPSPPVISGLIGCYINSNTYLMTPPPYVIYEVLNGRVGNNYLGPQMRRTTAIYYTGKSSGDNYDAITDTFW